MAGTNFVNGATVAAPGLSLGTVTVASATSITVPFTIPPTATLGPTNVTVTTAGGTSAALTFTVLPPAPTLTAMTPNSGAQGATGTMTLTGTNFVNGATVAAAGLSLGTVTVASTTSITVPFTIPPTATLGPTNVTVTTAGGTSAALPFTVNPPAPTLTAVSPTSGAQGATGTMTLTGTNFVNGATVAAPGLSLGTVTVASATSITVPFTIPPTAALGPTNVTVTTAGGTSAALPFTVLPPPPTLTAMTPNSGAQGTTVTVTLTGTNFVNGATVAAPGLTVGTVTVASTTSITVPFTIPPTATLGPANVTVTTAGGTSAALPFTVLPPPPTLTAVSPTSGAQGATGAMTLTGTNFVNGATVAAPGLSLGTVTVASTTSITVPFTIPPTATLGPTNVTVTTAGGTSAALTFTVLPPAPTLTAVSPTSGAQGATGTMTLTGTNFVNGATVAAAGLSLGTVTVASTTSITVPFTIPPTATLGPTNVTVTTAGGTSAALTFTVLPPAPTLTAMTPNSGAQGTTVTVTLTGTNFVNGATVAAPGLSLGTVTVASTTSITVPFTIPPTATLGPTNVTVTTAGGTSAALTFTVLPPPPTLTAMTPNSGAQGTTVTVTLTGTNFVNGATVAAPGLSLGTVTVASTTSITVPFTIPPTATLGPTNVTVTTAGGTSSPITFTVNPAVPTLTSVSPASGVQGTSVPVTLTGTNFTNGATVAVSNPGVAASGVTFVSATQITATLTIDVNAATGTANITVTTSGGTSNAVTFTVNPAVPTLTAVSPNYGAQGTTVTVTLTGTGFVSGATAVSVANAGIAVGAVNVLSATQLTVPFTIQGTAALGATNVTVTTSGGTSGAQTFTVNPPTPTLTSLSPASANQGAAVSVTLTGTNFARGATIAVGNPGVSLDTVLAWSSTQITANFGVDPAAAPGACNVTVTTSGGTSNAMPFTVIAVPAISSLSTTTALGGSQVTINGSYFGTTQGTGAVWLGTAPATVVSWSNTQIAATVAANAQSGNARVRQNGQWSQPVTFTVLTPTITGVDPPKAGPGDTVTISGSNFGDSQGSGQVWLGTAAAATVKSWNNTQIVATVAANAQSGNAQVLQNGVMSNQWPLTVNTPQIASLSTASAAAGTSVTFTGLGFGAAGSATLGSMAGLVQSWNDNTVVAQVASGSVSGIARIQRSDGLWSNALGFTVPAAGGGGAGMATALMPSLLNMSVGDTRTLQALGVDGKAVTGQMWSTSDATVVSLSTDDPPLLTALAPGHVTIKAGSASADVTVWAGVLPVGTTIWSNPGNGSGVQSIVPAVPSPNGVADVFAFQQDGTVQAITADGTTAWTASVSPSPNIFYPTLPDFQGGLVVAGGEKIWKLDGITGQAYPAYSCGELVGCGEQWAVHTDGTIFTVVTTSTNDMYVVGIDPTSGAEKFRVAPAVPGNSSNSHFLGVMIAGDGYFYAPYEYDVGWYTPTEVPTAYLRLLRVGSDGTSTDVGIYSWAAGRTDAETITWFSMITNADQGILISFETAEEGMVFNDWMATTGAAGTNRSQVSEPLSPMLQAQDGSFVGSDDNGNMVAFGASGNTLWSVPNESPAIATADGGVIGESGIVYDAQGNATGSMGSLPTQSWIGNMYQLGSVDRVAFPLILLAQSLWAAAGGNPSGTGAGRPRYFRVSFENDFTFTPSYPSVLDGLTTDISSSAAAIKKAVLKAIQDAYFGVPVVVFEGTSGGDNLILVLNEEEEKPPGCGVTLTTKVSPTAFALVSEIGYVRDMEEAQEALQLVIKNAQDEQAALTDPRVAQGIARGIGNIAAHEVAHQFLKGCCAMDANPYVDPDAKGTFNATGCNGRWPPSGDPSPWLGYWPGSPNVLLHWEQPALDALGECLAGGYRDFHGSTCHPKHN